MSEQHPSKISWNASQTHPELIDKLDSALREVVDPEIGLNVIELGLIQNVDIQEDSAHVSMIMTTPFCPYAPALLEMTRQKAEQAIGIPTTISMGMEAWDPSMMEEGVGSDWGIF
jgi:metal-sulfur cluster biosynthetic enzyme